MKRSHARRWGAVYIMLALFVCSWAAQFFTQMVAFGNEAQSHGETFQMNKYLPEFFASTFENWQSEWLQLFFQAIVLLGLKHVLFKADAEDMEQVQMDLAEIKDHLGIEPRDEQTRKELDDVRAARNASPGG
jgi:hypothetical protein